MKYNRGDYYARFLSSESCNSFYLNVLQLKRVEIEESNDEGSDRYHLPDPISLPESLRWTFNEGWLGETGRVCACVCNRKWQDASSHYDASEGSVDLDLAQRTLRCNISFFSSASLVSPLEASLSPSSTLFLLLPPPPLSWIYSLQGCLLQSNLILIPAAHPPIQQIER